VNTVRTKWYLRKTPYTEPKGGERKREVLVVGANSGEKRGTWISGGVGVGFLDAGEWGETVQRFGGSSSNNAGWGRGCRVVIFGEIGPPKHDSKVGVVQR